MSSETQLEVPSFVCLLIENITAPSSLTEGPLSAGCSLEERKKKTQPRMKQRESHSRGFSSLKFIMQIAELKCLHSARLISLSRPVRSAQTIHNRFEKSSGVRTIRLGMYVCVFTIFLCLPSSPLNTGYSE